MVLNKYDGTQGSIVEGDLKFFSSPILENFVFEINDDLLAMKIPICAKTTNDVSLDFESFIFDKKTESDMSYFGNGGHLIEEPCQSKNESDVCD